MKERTAYSFSGAASVLVSADNTWTSVGKVDGLTWGAN